MLHPYVIGIKSAMASSDILSVLTAIYPGTRTLDLLEAVRVEADEDVEVGGGEDPREPRLLAAGQQEAGQLQQQLPAHGLVT